MFDCQESVDYNNIPKFDRTALKDLTSNAHADSGMGSKAFDDSEYIVRLKDVYVYECILCNVVLVGDTAVEKHLDLFDHKVWDKELKDDKDDSKTRGDSFLHSSPNTTLEKINSIKENIDNISSHFERLCSGVKGNQIFNSTCLAEHHIEPPDELSTVFSEYTSESKDVISRNLTSESANEPIKTELPERFQQSVGLATSSGYTSNTASNSAEEEGQPSNVNLETQESVPKDKSNVEGDNTQFTLPSITEESTDDIPDNEKGQLETSDSSFKFNKSDTVILCSCCQNGKCRLHLEKETPKIKEEPPTENSQSDKTSEAQEPEVPSESFICPNCNFKFPSQTELTEHIEVDRCNGHDSSESDIDIEAIKSLFNLNRPPAATKSSDKALAVKLFPQPQSKENYIKRFLRPSPENILKVGSQKLAVLKNSLDLCLVTEKEVRCLICNDTCENDPVVFYEHFQSEKHNTIYNFLMQNENMAKDVKSSLNLAKNMLIPISKNVLQCACCKTSIGNYLNKIIGHINSKTHKLNALIVNNHMKVLHENILDKLSDMWYNIERYWCEPCNRKFFHEIHFSNHLDTWNHKKNVANKVFIYDICLPCGSTWLGLPNTYDIHSKILIHKYLLTNKVYEVGPLPSSVRNLLEDFEEQLKILKQDAEMGMEKFNENEEALSTSLEELLLAQLPNMKVQFYGSRVTGICCSKGAVDINLVFGYTSTGQTNCLFSQVQNQFIEKPEVWEMDCVVFRDAIPVIHLFHIPTKMKCNISIGDQLGVEKTWIIKSFIEQTPCKEMIIFLKRWFFLAELWNSKGISTVTICWMVIFFLQRKWDFPSINYVIQKRCLSHSIHDHKSHILETSIKHIIPKLPDVKHLLIDLFDFYSEFDYKTLVICPILGTTVKKEAFITGKNVPEEMLFNQTAEEFSAAFHVESPWFLQDPLNCKENVAKTVNKQTIRMLKQFCAESAKILANKAN